MVCRFLASNKVLTKNVSFPKAGKHMVKHMVSKNRVQKHILKKWSPTYALYPPMVHRRPFCGPGALGPRPTGEAQGPMARPAMGIRAQGSNGTPRWASRFPRLPRGQECKKYIHIHICICLCLCTLWKCCRPARYGSFNCQNKFDMFSAKQVLLTTHRLQFQTGEQQNQIGYIDLLAEIALDTDSMQSKTCEGTCVKLSISAYLRNWVDLANHTCYHRSRKHIICFSTFLVYGFGTATLFCLHFIIKSL